MRATAATGTSPAGGPATQRRRPHERRLVQRDGQKVLIETRATPDGPRTLVVPLADSAPLRESFVRELSASLDGHPDGPGSIRSTAMTEGEAAGFLDAGFEIQRRLHLLVLDVPTTAIARRTPSTPGVRLARSSRRHPDVLLAVDHAAFADDLRLDDADLASAMRATPVVRARLAREHGTAIGYAIFGRAGRRGYLQRLAVHPQAQGRGIGRALVLDGVRWCVRRRVERIVVNTEHGNDTALSLYRSLGFVDAPTGLVIVERALAAPGPR